MARISDQKARMARNTKIVAGIQKGETHGELAKRFGVSRLTIFNVAKANGLTKPRGQNNKQTTGRAASNPAPATNTGNLDAFLNDFRALVLHHQPEMSLTQYDSLVTKIRNVLG